ncbi:MAG TPA: FGGY family carbohydrate kinase [Chloroflexota bacterium]|nr:FGGY family carbohydrate kinase [Chloroflexota bacterium]
MQLIGIDLGTSFLKGAVLDLDPPSIGHIHREPVPNPVPGLPPLWNEYDAGEILAATRRLLIELAPFAPDCIGLMVSNQMSSLVLSDGEGRALSNCIGWRDQRSLASHPSGAGSYFDRLAESITPEERIQMGNELRPGLPISFLAWMAEAGCLPSGAIPASLGDFVAASLCNTAPSSDPTNGSAHGTLNIETVDWHYPVLERLGLGSLRWPQLHRSGDVVGTVRIGAREVPCYTPMGDQQVALASTFLKPRELWLNISTGSQVSLLTPTPQFGAAYRTRPSADGRFYKTITHIPGGRSMDQIMRLLCELAQAEGLQLRDPWGYAAHQAELLEQTDLKVNLSFFLSSCGDRGEISNIGEENLTVGHIFRAAYQNMADNYADCALRLSPDREWDSLVFSGGLAQKMGQLRRLIAEKFQTGYRMTASSEDALLGLLALGLLFTGQARTLEEAGRLIPEEHIQESR